jgi:hypothetical protein
LIAFGRSRRGRVVVAVVLILYSLFRFRQ